MESQDTINNDAPITKDTPLPKAAPTTPYFGKPSQPFTKTNMKNIANKFMIKPIINGVLTSPTARNAVIKAMPHPKAT